MNKNAEKGATATPANEASRKAESNDQEGTSDGTRRPEDRACSAAAFVSGAAASGRARNPTHPVKGYDARAERPAAGRWWRIKRLNAWAGLPQPGNRPRLGIRAGRLPRSSGPSSRACRLDKLARRANKTGGLLECRPGESHRDVGDGVMVGLDHRLPRPADGPPPSVRCLGCEGIVSKRLGSRYRSGRSADWIKVKNPTAPAVKLEAEEEWRK